MCRSRGHGPGVEVVGHIGKGCADDYKATPDRIDSALEALALWEDLESKICPVTVSGVAKWNDF